MNALTYFVLLFGALAALGWSASELFGKREDALGARLDDLQANALAISGRTTRRRAGNGLLDTFLYIVGLIPSLDSWLDDTERELAQAGIRKKESLAIYAMFHIAFFLTIFGGLMWVTRDGD